ncbi:MAG: hypothetical protein LQ346_001321 [Caloplaca aetnensis]|nr:MAG: hypothetical protein LQ346_001321 [Caloplaca aetnensis]
MDALMVKPTFSVFLLTGNSPNSSDEAVLDLLSHLVLLLGDVRLRRRISQAFVAERSQVEPLRPLLSHIMNQTLGLSRRFPQNPQINALCQKLLAILLGGLPMGDFVAMLEDLLERADTETRLDALKIFELRLGDSTPTPANGHEACLGFLTRLSSIINESEDEPVKRVALTCVDHIVERFGKKDVDVVLKVTNTVAGPQCLGAVSGEIRVTSLLCLSTVVEVAQDGFVPFVPQTLPKVLDLLNREIEEGSCSKRLHNAAYSFLSSLLLYSPWAIAAPDLDLLLKVSHGSANANLDEACSAERRTTLEFVARQIELRDCCAALEGTWANAMAEGPEALKEHLLVLENLLRRSTKSAIGRQSETFARLLTKAFDLRRIQFCPRTDDSYEEKEVEEVEDAANEAAIAMVTKVNDTIFRPMFVQLVEWAAASSAKAKVYRQTTVYGFFMRFFDRFEASESRSIVTNYAALILDDAIAILRQSVVTDEASKLLWAKVIQTLQVCFQHDQNGFWQSPAHFGPIAEVLLDQLKQAAEVSAADVVIPSITDLAAAADSVVHHKSLNTVVLQYMRSDSVAVRLAAVKCQQSLTARLGEEWLALLPEMLPFISELQEDDYENVERETLRWIKQIEEILGESLTPMLQ